MRRNSPCPCCHTRTVPHPNSSSRSPAGRQGRGVLSARLCTGDHRKSPHAKGTKQPSRPTKRNLREWCRCLCPRCSPSTPSSHPTPSPCPQTRSNICSFFWVARTQPVGSEPARKRSRNLACVGVVSAADGEADLHITTTKITGRWIPMIMTVSLSREIMTL